LISATIVKAYQSDTPFFIIFSRMNIKLETPRLYLREFTLADVELLYTMHQDTAITRYTGDPLPWDSLAHTEKVLVEAILPQYKNGIGRWAVHIKETNEFIGWCGLKQVDEEIDLGYRYMQQFWGYGYATEAAQAVLHWGIQQQLKNIIGRADVENVASVNVLKKIGMKFLEYYTDERGCMSVKFIAE
jgi:RimJ/RimL family protein N-acetyltransferase